MSNIIFVKYYICRVFYFTHVKSIFSTTVLEDTESDILNSLVATHRSALEQWGVIDDQIKQLVDSRDFVNAERLLTARLKDGYSSSVLKECQNQINAYNSDIASMGKRLEKAQKLYDLDKLNDEISQCQQMISEKRYGCIYKKK